MSFQIFITSFLLHKWSNFEKCGLFYFPVQLQWMCMNWRFRVPKKVQKHYKVVRVTSENVIALYDEQAKM